MAQHLGSLELCCRVSLRCDLHDLVDKLVMQSPRSLGSLLMIGIGVCTLLAGMGTEAPGQPGEAAEKPITLRKVDFNRDVRPILSEHCFRCHGPDAAAVAANLRLDKQESATADRGGYQAIHPGKPQDSRLLARVSAQEDYMRMPPPDSGVAPLTKEQIETLRLWIESGAEYRAHWAFVTPVAGALPSVSDKTWARNPLDRFVLARLEEAGLKPAKTADKRTLIRRASLALTGLPPSPEETEAFLADKSANAYEKVVDRLLASPRYGEHQARYWLDAVRYGDTHGLHLDNERSIWPYRDWVVRAYNEDLPFDQFATWQVAGDLLPNPTTEQLIATGFVRMNPTTAEGGAIEEEFLVKNTFDRVDTFSTVFLGLTTGCAKCHDHKYDPITQKEYYGLFAYFNSTTDAPLDGNALAPAPAMRAPNPDQERMLKDYKTKLSSIESSVNQAEALEWVRMVHASPPTFSAWEISPVYSAADFDKAHETAFPPEKGDVEWKPTEIVLGKLRTSIVVTANSAVYLRTTITSEKAGDVVLRLGSDDSIKLWLNGTLIHDNKALRALAPDQDSVNLPLKAGANTVLVKVVNAAGGDGFYVAYSDPKAERIERAFRSTQRPRMTEEDLREVSILYLTYGPASENQMSYLETAGALDLFEKSLPMTLIAQEMAKPRETRLLFRGEYDHPREVVDRGIPASLGALPKGAPNNRLGLAEWMVSKDNPLTARVYVNRVWQQHFGRGLVHSAENFGLQGEWPSNPELLDYLARKFVDEGWSTKKLHREIVTSATFMQDSAVTADKLERDPLNVLNSRGPRFRLDAEVLRDVALFASGTLVERLGGRGFKTYQPEGLWEAVAYPTSNTAKYVQDHGPEIYRRSLYLFWKRTSPPPAMSVFDAPTREACIVNRSRTNTPLQALVVLNGRQFVEAARNMAQRVIKARPETSGRIDYAFRIATGRPPTSKEAEILLNVFNSQAKHFSQDQEDAMKLLSVGESKRDQSIPPDVHAAWTMVCNTLLNLDETVTQH